MSLTDTELVCRALKRLFSRFGNFKMMTRIPGFQLLYLDEIECPVVKCVHNEGREGSWTNPRCYPGICLDILSKITATLERRAST